MVFCLEGPDVRLYFIPTARGSITWADSARTRSPRAALTDNRHYSATRGQPSDAGDTTAAGSRRRCRGQLGRVYGDGKEGGT